MTFPPLVPGWEPTRDSLHSATRVLGAIRIAAIEPLPNELHYSVIPTSRGCSTGELDVGGELVLDFARGAISCVEGENERFSVALAGHHQRSLFEAVLSELTGVSKSIDASDEKITSEELFTFDPKVADDAGAVFAQVWNALARFRARLSGFMTPVVLWPHHFDLSFLWFPGPGTNEETDRQMNFGFAPVSEGFAAPYLYGYCWPMKNEAELPPELVAPARWHDEGWKGAVVDYGDFAEAPTPQQVIEDTMMASFFTLRALLASAGDET